MNIEILLYGQLITIVSFVGAIFVLYRLLVKNKEATIQLLEKQIEHINHNVSMNGADILSVNLEKRVFGLSSEIKRLNEDKAINTELIQEKESELTDAKEMYERMQKMILHTSGMSISYFCPTCEEPTLEYAEAKAHFKSQDKGSFLVAYECGYSISNGQEVSKCQKENR